MTGSRSFNNPPPSPLTTRWVHRSFLRDGKLRPRERYWRPASLLEATTSHPLSTCDLCIIPDGRTWRKYLSLLQSLISKHTTNASSLLIQWTLLESAAEVMDHRNQAPNDEKERREYCHSQERTTLMRLMRQHGNACRVFCDLSVRDNDDDQEEWDWLTFEQLTVEDRSQHALARAARIILEHDTPRVWLVSADNKFVNDQVQLEEGVERVSMHNLLDRLVQEGAVSESDLVTLNDLKQACETEYERMNRRPEATNIVSGQDIVALLPEEIQIGLCNKSLFRGRLNVTKENPREAFVSVDNIQYFIEKQRGHFSRAFHGDIVIVQPLPEDQWGRPVGKHRLVHYRDDDDDESDDATAELLAFPPVPSARVVNVVEPSRRLFIATMVAAPRDNDSHVLVIPMDIRIPKIRIHAKLWRSYVGMRLKIQVDGWDEGSTYPSGRCIEVVGPIGDLETELAALLLENQVELEPFSAAARACLPYEGDNWTIGKEEIDKRRDLRTCRHIFSVDPPGCQDIDDSMHALELPNGDIEFGVHIADVTHFVKHESALDKEAQLRGTTFYLVDRRFDMLPALLSSNLCSLHGHVDRLAVSVIWVFSSDLQEIKSTWYGRTVIRNCAAMTYDQADRILRDEPPNDSNSQTIPALTAGGPVDRQLVPCLKPALLLLTRLARKLRTDRETIGGAVDLSSGDVGNELKFTLVDGKPVKVVPKTDKEIHHTIAEMMILANTSVATKIYEQFPDSALLRIHRTVEEERFEELKEIFDAGNIDFKGNSNADVAKSLKEAKKRLHSNPVVNALLLSLATRAMSEAQYVSAGERLGDGADFSHYGLGLKYYTHFTSPIRRYADVVVHKQLLASLCIEQSTPATISGKSLLPQRKSLDILPDSNVISIMAGEGLASIIHEEENFLDDLIEGATVLALGTKAETNILASSNQSQMKDDFMVQTKPYNGSMVSSICERLNLHNRLAKYSSHECQRLFLSLYFRNNCATVEAVVLNLRANGFWVYIPRFDMKAPVYLRDVSGQVQVDPGLLGLPPDAGVEATAGFASAGTIRRFPDGRCDLFTKDEERIVVSIPGARASFTVRPLDILQVRISSDTWDVSARVPNPRVQLIASSNIRPSLSSSATVKVNSHVLERPTDSANKAMHEIAMEDQMSLYSVLSSIEIHPLVDVTPQHQSGKRRVASELREVSLAGRFIYSKFINPDSRSTQQELAQQNAAAEAAKRRAQAIAHATNRSEYDSVKQYERDAMVRQQRLAADKRNARIAKSRKGK